jgi:hypothetical protein
VTFIKAFQNGLSSFHSDFPLGILPKKDYLPLVGDPLGDFQQSLSKKCFAFFWLLYFMSTPASELARFPKIQKPLTFVRGFVIRIGFEPMALILEG